MPTTNRNLLLSCLVIAGVFCLCLSLVSIIGAGVLILDQRGLLRAPTETPSAPVTPLSIEAQMDLIEEQVMELRGLAATTKVARQLLSPEELRAKVLEDFFEDYTTQDAQEDALVLWGFGLLNRDFDLYNFYIDLYSEQIAGYYDQEAKVMYVVQEDAFAGPERLTYAHEFVHALQDQHYDIENGLQFNDETCKEDSERCAAISALLEGDASIAESQWFAQYATPQDRLEISQFYSTFESPVYDRAPAFMQQDFLFPYQQGQEFVQELYSQGGWEAVNQAYAQPPVSTEQILHPEQYPEDLPEPIELPDLSAILGTGWEEIDRGVMGEWYLYLILSAGLEASAQISSSEAQRAAAGWKGDAYAVYYHSELDQLSLVLSIEWDSAAQALEFRRAFEKYADQRFGEATLRQDDQMQWRQDAGVHSLFVQENRTIWVAAPTAALVAAIAQQINQP